MARAIWSGAISFGLVNVPVKLYSATSPKTVRFHQLHAKDGVRIQQKRICPADGEEVPYDQLVKGYEISPDRYVILRPEELEALDPRHTKTIDIEAFVELAEIDPVYYDNAYHVAPATGGSKAYALLLRSMEEAGKVAIGRFVLRTKQQICALRPADGVLMLSTMLFGDEVNSPERLDELEGLGEAEATRAEVAMAQQLIESLSTPFDPSAFRDEYRERVLDLIERKAAGEEIAVQPASEAPPEVPDLMAALEASVAAVRGDGASAAGSARKSRAKAGRAPARRRARAGSRS